MRERFGASWNYVTRAGFGLLLAVLLLSCRGTAPVRETGAPAGDELSARLSAISRDMLKRLPKGSRVVVSNFSRLGSSQTTMLGVYLAKRLSVALKTEDTTQVTLVDRGAGEQAVTQEMEFTPDPTDPRALLGHFKAEYAITVTYDIRPDSLLELVEAEAVPTTGAEVPFACQCVVRSGSDDVRYWQKLENEPLPNMTEKQRRFVAESGRLNAVEGLRLELSSGAEVPANGEVAIDSRLRITVQLSQACPLYVLSWDQTHSRTFVAFPGPGRPALAGPGEITIPESGYFRSYGPAGYNWVKAIALKQDVGFVVSDSSCQDAQALDALADTIMSLGPDNWGAKTFGYWNVER